MKIKHIFFDLDHTLWDFETNSDMAFKTIFEKHKVKTSLEKFLNYYRTINQNYWALYRNEQISKEDLRYGRLKDTFKIINFKASDDLIQQLAHDYIDVLPHNNYLFDGTVELLDYLFLKYKLHIITNGFNEVQYKKISKSGLDKYFDQIITSEAVGFKKPNPLIFSHALEKANSSAEESIMIGDNWEADIMGAQNAGLDVIYFNINGDVVAPNVKSVTNLLSIKNYL